MINFSCMNCCWKTQRISVSKHFMGFLDSFDYFFSFVFQDRCFHWVRDFRSQLFPSLISVWVKFWIRMKACVHLLVILLLARTLQADRQTVEPELISFSPESKVNEGKKAFKLNLQLLNFFNILSEHEAISSDLIIASLIPSNTQQLVQKTGSTLTISLSMIAVYFTIIFFVFWNVKRNQLQALRKKIITIDYQEI